MTEMKELARQMITNKEIDANLDKVQNLFTNLKKVWEERFQNKIKEIEEIRRV